MKKMLDLLVTSNEQLNDNYCKLTLTTKDGSKLPAMHPGQFVEVQVENSSTTFLRRPLSVNFVDEDKNELWLLIQIVGDGTKQMSLLKKGDILNLLLPLGNSFNCQSLTNSDKKALLIGGGVGIAPILFLSSQLHKQGIKPTILIGARSKKDLLQLDELEKYGDVYCTTEDESYGEKGYVINHSILKEANFQAIYTCGPKPMMVAVAKYAAANNIDCQVSLENTMACGFGVCLCCIEDTKEGNICVCTEGPVFNIKELKWIN